MAISDHAQAHDALFPLNDSTLPQTDPELADLFGNWALGDVVAHGGIDTRTRVLIQLASLIAMQAQGAYRLMVGTALDSGVSPVEVKEVLYQAIPYAGMGKVYDFLHITNEVFASRGIALPVEGQSTTGPDTRWQAGFNLQIEVFGPRIQEGYDSAPANQVHVNDYLAANCFGDYYTRTGLDLATRELLTFCMLVSMGGAEPQAVGHAKGNAAVGNDKDFLINAVTQLLPFLGYPRTLNALRCINEALPD